jgi:tRNA threonylcarbamoyladenosine biosynthesis protein TsaE
MQNAECEMRNDERPAGKSGRPFFRSWWAAALVYGAGYAFGFFAMVVAIGSLLHGLLPRVTLDAAKAARYSVFLLLEPLVLVALSRPVWSKWKDRLSEFRIPNWYLLATGILCAGVAALTIWGVLLLPVKQWVMTVCVYSIMYSGPILGIWWILRYRPRPVDPDYDDMFETVRGDDKHIDLPNLAATESFGRRLGSLLFPNAVIALVGPLGAGKTHLARAIAEGLGIANPAAVTSPTFTLIHEYPARLPIFHFDAYRLNSADEFLDLGATEYYEAGGVCLIEWADRVEAALPEERLTIRLTPLDENRRRADMTAAGPTHGELLKRLAGSSQ